MQISNLKKYRTFFFAALAVIAAAVLRQIGFHVNEQLNLFCIIFRFLIYIGLFAAGGFPSADGSSSRRCAAILPLLPR